MNQLIYIDIHPSRADDTFTREEMEVAYSELRGRLSRNVYSFRLIISQTSELIMLAKIYRKHIRST